VYDLGIVSIFFSISASTHLNLVLLTFSTPKIELANPVLLAKKAASVFFMILLFCAQKLQDKSALCLCHKWIRHFSALSPKP
jgi:hypothetical protein